MAPRGQSRSKLIEVMRELALRNGYSATGVDEVCAAAGVSKGSFYHHFSSKEDLARAAIEAYYDELTAAMDAGDATSAEPSGAVDRLHGFLARARTAATGPLLVNGCLLGVLTLDLAESHPEIRHDIAHRFDTLAAAIAGLIEAAAVERGVELPAADLARHFLAVLEGAIVLSKAAADPAVVLASLDLYAQTLDRLLISEPSA